MQRQGAMLVLVNHLSPYDIIAFCPPIFPTKATCVVAENMMYSNRFFASVIKNFHAITKRQYFADIRCIMSIKRYLDAGVSVVLCPEGKVAANGSTGVIPQSIAKLIKWLRYPVSTITVSGMGLMRPKWARNARFGRIESHCDALLTSEQIADLSKEEIFDRVTNALAHDEHKWQAENNVRFIGRNLAKGLDKILFRCPECGEEFRMTSKGDHLICTACGNDVVYKSDGRLVAKDGSHATFDRIDKWYEYERNCVKTQLMQPNFTLKDDVSLFVEKPEQPGYRLVAYGKLTLDGKNLSFCASSDEIPAGVKTAFKVNNMKIDPSETRDSEPVKKEFMELSFPLSSFETVANMPGTSIDVYDEKHVYRFMFTNRLAATKYAMAIEQIAMDRQGGDGMNE